MKNHSFLSTKNYLSENVPTESASAEDLAALPVSKAAAALGEPWPAGRSLEPLGNFLGKAREEIQAMRGIGTKKATTLVRILAYAETDPKSLLGRHASTTGKRSVETFLSTNTPGARRVKKELFDKIAGGLSVRSSRYLENRLGRNFSCERFLQFIARHNLPSKGPNFGKSSVREIEVFHRRICKLIESFKDGIGVDETFSRLTELWMKVYKTPESYFEEYRDAFADGRFPLAKVWERLLREGYALPNRATRVIFFRRSGQLADFPVETLQSVGDRLGMTRERVRQISEKSVRGKSIPTILPSRAAWLLAAADHSRNLPVLGANFDFVVLGGKATRLLNQANDVNFTSLGWAELARMLDSSTKVGNPPKGSKTFFLSKKSLTEAFDFSGFAESFKANFETKRKTDERISLKSLLPPFLRAEAEEDTSLILPACRALASSWTGAEFEEGDVLVLPANARLSGSDRVRLAFEKAERPMRIDEVTELVNENQDNALCIRYVRALLQQGNEFLLRRSGCFWYLAEWERESSPVKLDFPEQKSQPKRQRDRDRLLNEHDCVSRRLGVNTTTERELLKYGRHSKEEYERLFGSVKNFLGFARGEDEINREIS
jgi:hypothetical protein